MAEELKKKMNEQQERFRKEQQNYRSESSWDNWNSAGKGGPE